MSCLTDIYKFQLEQVELDRQILKSIITIESIKRLDNSILEYYNITENKITDAIRGFFKAIIEKIQSFIDFLKNIFTKQSESKAETKHIANKIDDVIIKHKNIDITLENVRCDEIDMDKYKKFINMSNFNKMRIFDIAIAITDFFRSPDERKDDIKINVQEFHKRVKEKTYASSVDFIMPNGLTTAQDVKNFIYKEVYGEAEIQYSDMKITNKELDKLKDSLSFLDNVGRDLEKLIDDNVKQLEKHKKILMSCEKTVQTTDLFDIFKVYTTDLIHLFNYNKDVTVILLNISRDHVLMTNAIINKVNMQLKQPK